jgi:hypothetical protein
MVSEEGTGNEELRQDREDEEEMGDENMSNDYDDDDDEAPINGKELALLWRGWLPRSNDIRKFYEALHRVLTGKGR